MDSPDILARPVASTDTHPLVVRVDATTEDFLEHVRAVYAFKSSSMPIICTNKTWSLAGPAVMRAAKLHPLYDIVVAGQGCVRRSPEAALRRVGDLERWEHGVRTARGADAAASLVAAAVQRGRHRKSLRKNKPKSQSRS